MILESGKTPGRETEKTPMINLRTLKSSELVSMYNAAAEKLGVKGVNKFADKETAIVRTKALMAKLGTEVADAEVKRVSTIPPAPGLPKDLVETTTKVEPRATKRPTVAPAAKAKTIAPKAAKATKEKQTRRMSFQFKPMSKQREIKNTASLRALCFEKMSGEGCKFDAVVRLVEKFDNNRGSGNGETIERRAYELVRIMHYQLGYGIQHDEATGYIRVYA
jgi:hypothetical protein